MVSFAGILAQGCAPFPAERSAPPPNIMPSRWRGHARLLLNELHCPRGSAQLLSQNEQSHCSERRRLQSDLLKDISQSISMDKLEQSAFAGSEALLLHRPQDSWKLADDVVLDHIFNIEAFIHHNLEDAIKKPGLAIFLWATARLPGGTVSEALFSWFAQVEDELMVTGDFSDADVEKMERVASALIYAGGAQAELLVKKLLNSGWDMVCPAETCSWNAARHRLVLTAIFFDNPAAAEAAEKAWFDAASHHVGQRITSYMQDPVAVLVCLGKSDGRYARLRAVSGALLLALLEVRSPEILVSFGMAGGLSSWEDERCLNLRKRIAASLEEIARETAPPVIHKENVGAYEREIDRLFARGQGSGVALPIINSTVFSHKIRTTCEGVAYHANVQRWLHRLLLPEECAPRYAPAGDWENLKLLVDSKRCERGSNAGRSENMPPKMLSLQKVEAQKAPSYPDTEGSELNYNFHPSCQPAQSDSFPSAQYGARTLHAQTAGFGPQAVFASPVPNLFWQLMTYNGTQMLPVYCPTACCCPMVAQQAMAAQEFMAAPEPKAQYSINVQEKGCGDPLEKYSQVRADQDFLKCKDDDDYEGSRKESVTGGADDNSECATEDSITKKSSQSQWAVTKESEDKIHEDSTVHGSYKKKNRRSCRGGKKRQKQYIADWHGQRHWHAKNFSDRSHWHAKNFSDRSHWRAKNSFDGSYWNAENSSDRSALNPLYINPCPWAPGPTRRHGARWYVVTSTRRNM